MLFNSLKFALFFPIVLIAIYFIKGNNNFRKIFLLIASFIFYMSWKWQYVYLICYSILLNFYFAKAVYAAESLKNKRRLLILSVALNLVFLGIFKYYNFFIFNVSALLSTLGIGSLNTVKLILPIGISFYTFQAMSYTIDVYRGKIVPARLLDLALYISFFPQLVAGPIVRASSLIPQFQKAPIIKSDKFVSGSHLVFWGLFKKMVLADNLAPFVNQVFLNYKDCNWLTILFGVYAFGFQIYYDFSGYSDIAIGCGRMMGYDIPKNFNLPYLAKGFSDFWRRWHISLSSWLRDYLYIPLGGNHNRFKITCLNILVTMLLGGLWHGASWTFIVWGGLHGAYIIIQKFIERKIYIPETKLNNIIKVFITFQIVSLTWVFFRANSFTAAGDMLLSVFTLQGGDNYLSLGVVMILAFSFISHFVEYKHPVYEKFLAQPYYIKYSIYSLGIFLIVFNHDIIANQFIYFQF